MLEEFSEYFRNLELDDPDSTCGTSDYDVEFDNDPDDCYCEEYNKTGETEKFHKELKKELFAERVKNIHNKYEADKKPPTGNQNCLLCSWCAEAYFRGKDVLPRPVYSPRDPVLFVDPTSIVLKSTKYIFENMRELMECVDKPNTRWYVHVKWEGGTGGHEFLIINMNNIPEIVDAQQGLIEPVTNLKAFNDYFGNIDWHESYACRLDDRTFNKEIFNKCNDPSAIVPWDAKLDIPYMLKEGMITEEEAEQYWKDHPDEAPDDRHFLSYEELDRMSGSKNIFTSGDFDKYGKDVDLTDARGPITEAWNDIKNGVNPYSKKLWFHVSRSDKHEGKVFTPRVPDYLYNQEKLGKDDPYYEDMTIPRICFSPSIEGALHAIISMGDRIGTAGEEFYVYIPEKPINEYKHMTNKEIVDKKLVFDAKYTKECWITEPVKLILYGSIVIDQVYNHRSKPTANGKSNVGVVSYKWHWQTKPQVVKGTGHEAFAWNEEPEQNKKKKSKSIKEAFEMGVLERDPKVIKMFLEADNDGDEDNTNNTDIEVTDIEMGSDDGSGEQNQYDPEEVEYLNHLIAAEAEAISDYFEGGKKTKVPVLSKLYSDIGEEERFHLEQLIYAKSTITGEKYEPKDPEVRKEYEELLALGMDEQTAMTTAVDKLSISVKEEEPDEDMTDEEIDDIKESFELIYSVSQSTSLQTEALLDSAIVQKRIRDDIIESTNSFFEQVFIMEEVSNLNTRAGQQELGSKNPIAMVLKAISGIYRLVISLVKKAKLAFQKTRLKSKAKWTWIKKHGIKGLFANGVSMYFYSDKKMKYDVGDALKYLKLINDTCDIIIRDSGIKNVDQNKYKIDKYIEKLKASTPDVDSFIINTLDEGISKLNGSNLFKVKMIVNDNNEKEIEEQFFGYTEKNFLAITKEGENSRQINLSNNIYNKMDIILNAFNLCSAKSVEIGNGLNALSEKPNTIFQSNPKLFNKCVSALSVVSKSLNKFTSAVSSDLTTMMNLNKGLNELARRYEETRSKEDKEKLAEYNKGRDEAKQQADAAAKSSNDTKSTYNV